MGKLYLTWQYNGVAPWDELIDWCKAHIENAWSFQFETIFFYTEADLTMFLLRWGGR